MLYFKFKRIDHYILFLQARFNKSMEYVLPVFFAHSFLMPSNALHPTFVLGIMRDAKDFLEDCEGAGRNLPLATPSELRTNCGHCPDEAIT